MAKLFDGEPPANFCKYCSVSNGGECSSPDVETDLVSKLRLAKFALTKKFNPICNAVIKSDNPETIALFQEQCPGHEARG